MTTLQNARLAHKQAHAHQTSTQPKSPLEVIREEQASDVNPTIPAQTTPASHTPGPWSTEPVTLIESRAFVTAQGQAIIAEIPLSSIVSLHDEQAANARLIAAAPETAAERDRLKELIEGDITDALENAIRQLEDCADHLNRISDHNIYARDALEAAKQARAAISLATQSPL